MTEATLETCAKVLVSRFINATLNKAQYPNGSTFRVHTVWKCYILGDMKFLITSDLPDGKYYEVTYSAEKQEFYLDAYVRVHNEAVSLSDTCLSISIWGE